MARSRRRKGSDPTEDILRVVFVLAMLLALATGGIAGFARTFTALVVIGVFVLIVGFFGWLIIGSALITPKKAALLCLLGAATTFVIWKSILPPEQWPAVEATLSKLTTPKKVTRCVYRYEFGGKSYSFETTQPWPEKTKGKEPTLIRLDGFVDPANPAEFSRVRRPGARAVSAALIQGNVEHDGPFTGTIRYGSGFGAKSATITGSYLSTLAVGSRFPIYINPADPTEMRLDPQKYNGPKNYPLLFLSIGFLIVGVGLIAVRPKDWIATPPSQPPSNPDALPPSLSLVGTKSQRSRQVESPSSAPVWTTSQRLRQVDWFQFEKICERILKKEGWEVTRRGGANPDGGADLVASRPGRTVVVQCKFWKNWAVPPKVMRELLGTKVSSGFAADSAMLFALQCSAEARQFAKENDITVYEEAETVGFIERIGVESFPELMDPDDKACPKCGAMMVRREGARGAFWGCSQFGVTRCRGKIEIEGE